MAGKKAGSGRPKSRGKPAKSRAPKRAAPRRAASKAKARPAPKPAAAKGVPNAIGLWRHHLDYTSHDLAAIKRFYGETLGFTRMTEDAKMGYLSIHTTPTTSLGFMSPVPAPPEQWRPPGEPALYFFVKDVDRAHRDLLARGVSFQQKPTDMPWGHRVATCRDPEGRMVCLAQDLARG